MKDVFLAAQIYPPEIGGAATYFSQLSGVVDEMEGYRPTVVTGYSDEYPVMEYDGDVPVLRVCTRDPEKAMDEIGGPPLSVIKERLDRTPDLIHIHPHLDGIPSLFNSPEGQDLVSIYDYRGVSKRMDDPEYGRGDVCMSVSEGVDRELIRRKGKYRSDIYRSPVVVDIDEVGSTKSREKERFRCIFVASLQRHKGLHIAAAAVMQLDTLGEELELIIIGDGPERLLADSLSRENEFIEYLGAMRHENVLAEMEEADLLVAPSDLEADPRVIIEALEMNTPVVATDRGKIEERVGDAGIIVVRDDAMIRRAIEDVIQYQDTYEKLAVERDPTPWTKEDLKQQLGRAYTEALEYYT